jgi:hypothetical protein
MIIRSLKLGLNSVPAHAQNDDVSVEVPRPFSSPAISEPEDPEDFIHHPRRLDPLLKDKPAWNMLTSAMDVVSDTEWSRAAQNSVEVAA